MQKKTLFFLLTTVSAIFVLTCSGLDDYSTTGSEIVDKFDPTLNNFQDNFHPVSCDTSKVTAAYSAPLLTNNTQGDGFGYHGGSLSSGKVGSVLLYGCSEFVLTRNFCDNNTVDSSKTFDSITFVYDTLGGADYKNSFDNSLTLKLYHTSKTDRYYISRQDTLFESACTLKTSVNGDSTRFTGTLADTLLRDSIFQIIRFLRDSSKDSSKDSLFHLSLFNSSSRLWFNDNPAMVIHTSKKADNVTTHYSDTIRGSSMYMAHESDSLKRALDTLPVSTFLSRRTAVFKINFNEFWDSLKLSGFNEILTAAIVLETDTIITENPDSSSYIRYLFNDSLFDDGMIFSERIDSAIAQSYPYSCKVNSSHDTLVIPVTRQVQNHIGNKPQFFYLYVQISLSTALTQHEILWKKPQIKAILTTIR